jgi:chromosome segregation ATPase
MIQPNRRNRCCLLAVLLGLAAIGAHAQQDTRSQREREALRRAQATVQQTRAELEALRSERDALLKDKDAAATQARSTDNKLDAARKDSAALRAELSRTQAQQAEDARRHAQALQDSLAEGRQREQQLQRELSALQRERDELVRLNANVVAVLEQRTAQLAELRQRNLGLHALALEAVERYRSKSALDVAHQGDPVFGLARVRTESVAEELRMRIDAQRSPPP